METRITETLAVLLREGAHKPPNEYSSLALAYLGDAVFELYVRTLLIDQGNLPVQKLHRAATGFVSAHAQSAMMKKWEPNLTQTELAVFKRGRNAKPGTIPKNADVGEYHRATGLEALVGYLYLDGQLERLQELISLAVQIEGK